MTEKKNKLKIRMLGLAAQQQLPDPQPTEASTNGLATGSRAWQEL